MIIIVIVEPTGWKTRDDQMKLYRFYVRTKTTRTRLVDFIYAQKQQERALSIKQNGGDRIFTAVYEFRSRATTGRHRLTMMRTFIG